jgi:pilus assembly protein CpaB
MFASLRHRLPRIGRLPRLCAAGICLLLAANSALTGRPAAAAPRTAPVVVAARNLPPGHVLAAADLRVARWPAAVRPPSARADHVGLIGRRLTGPVGAGEPVTATRVLGRDLAAQLPPGLVAAPVVIADPHAADLLHAGERADLLSVRRPPELPETANPPPAPVTTVVQRALVLAVFVEPDGTGTEVVLAVGRSVAVRIVRDTATHVFTAVAAPP